MTDGDRTDKPIVGTEDEGHSCMVGWPVAEALHALNPPLETLRLANALRIQHENIIRSHIQRLNREVIKYRDFHRYVLDNMICMNGRTDNAPCTLNQSDDQNEFCLYHKALDIKEGRP